MRDSLTRLRLILEQNFIYIESMGLLSVTRYLFEVVVWIKLMEKDHTYGLVYYKQLMETQGDYYKRLKEHLLREIAFLKNLERQENEMMKKRASEVEAISDLTAREKALLQLGPNVVREIDDIASRRFTLYGDQAKTNGYSFQAYLVETKVLPQVCNSIKAIDEELVTFKSSVPGNILQFPPLMKQKWPWIERAKVVDMQDEYDFIYSYTSRLLHATPPSITTNQKNLELSEVIMFLKYFHVRLLDVIEIARKLLDPRKLQHAGINK